MLLKAGPEFWGLSGAEIFSRRRIPCPLSFWHIDEEGEVKAKLRPRMVDAERCLSVREQQDILDEAGRTFGMSRWRCLRGGWMRMGDLLMLTGV